MSINSSHPRLVVVGSTNIDLIAYTDRIPGSGETLIGQRFEMGFGGKGANQAVMARRLGAEVSMVNAIGNDIYGQMTLDNFAIHGVDTTFVHIVDEPSGVAPIWVEPDGSNRIIVIPGANNHLAAGQAVAAVAALDGLRAVIGQFEIPQHVTAAAFGEAKRKGVVTVLNPAPGGVVDNDLLEVTDWLVPNEGEFELISGSPANEESFCRFADVWSVRLVVTLGPAGVALVGADGKVIRIPAEEVVAVDTTGAGDAFVGSFAYGLAAGMKETDAARLGVVCASDSVTRRGTQTSFPSVEDCRELVANLT